MANRQGQILHHWCNKPCALATRLQGEFELNPTPEHCRQVGAALARMHEVGLDYRRQRPELMLDNPRGLSWWQETLPRVLPHTSPALQQLLTQELQAQTEYASTPDYAQLSRSPVHADLFRNNVLFAGTHDQPRLGGFIDFYFAGVDTWLFDVAVTVNDWCIDLATGAIDAPRYAALLHAYALVRPFSPAEHRAWPMMLRAGALRFWISRLYDFYLPRAAANLTPHDPAHFEHVLRLRRLHEHSLP
jgi:homoserine kinase type II